MPMFNYQCKECGFYITDKLVKKADDIIKCPMCNHEMEKKPSGISFKINIKD